MSSHYKKLPGTGDYGKVTAYMSKKQVYTKADIVEFLRRQCGKTEKASIHTAVVMLSPRLTSDRGDPRGNASNPWGHIAYNDKLQRKTKNGKREPQKYRLRRRKVELPVRTRNETTVVEAEKVSANEKVKVAEKATEVI